MIAAVSAVMAAVAIVSVTVYAHLQSEQNQPNQFNIGEDKTAVTEAFTEPSNMHMQDNFEKKVAVQNTGTSNQFVRVYLDFSDSRIREQAKIIYTKNNVNLTKIWSDFLFDLPENWEYIRETQTGDDQILGGYFYYTQILEPGATMPNLIDGIMTDFSTNPTDTNTDRIQDFDIIVYSESVQTIETDGSGAVYDDWRAVWKRFLHPTA